MKYFVTGGSGFIGQHLLLRLLADGHVVRALARSDEAVRTVEGLGATAVRGDLGDVDSLVDEIRGSAVVVHAAADVRAWRPSHEINVTGTSRMLDAAREAGVRRFVHVSTEAVLVDGKPLRFVDESAPYPSKHVGEYARTKALAEQLVLSANSRQMRTVAVRPRLVWGPGDTTLLPELLDAARSGRWVWMDGGHYLTSTCHVANLCEGIELAVERGEGGRAYFLTDGAPVEFRDFITRCAAAYGVRMPKRSVPTGVLRTGAAVVDRTWRVLHLKGMPPIFPAVVALVGQEMTVNDARAREELKYVPLVSVDEGIEQLAAQAAADSPEA
jgi:nucleoside-diphosphate-sugar epimerase